MANFKDDIINAMGEPIEFIRIHNNNEYPYCESSKILPKEYVGMPLHWTEEVEAMLDFEYDDGFGSQDCPNITVWSQHKVGYVHEYDGSTSIETVDRNPENKTP